MSTSVGVDSQAEPVGKPEPAGKAVGDPPAAVTATVTVAAAVTHTWEVLVSPAGARALLGEGALLGAKGEAYHCADGTYGVVRSYHPLEQLRVSWHAAPDSPATIVEVDLRADGEGTLLELSQTHLHEGLDLGALETRWAAALGAVAGAARA